MVSSTTATSISLSWTASSGSIDSYEITWRKSSSEQCTDDERGNTTITDGSTSYTITGLEEYSNYSITVTATNALGSVVGHSISGMTGEAGEGLIVVVKMDTMDKLSPISSSFSSS